MGIDFWNEVLEGQLWLGNLAQARKKAWLLEKKITHVCAVTQWGKGAIFFEDDFEYFTIHIEDKPGCDLLKYLEKAVSFIENAIDGGGRVYVHCNQGRSRSGTVVVALFIKRFGLDVATALSRVREKRSVVCPNEGFMKQLEQWQHLCVSRRWAEQIREALTSRHRHISPVVEEKLVSIVCRYLFGDDRELVGKDKAKISKKEKMVAEAATMFFKLTHSLQGIPYQNNIIPEKLWLGQLGAARNYEWLKKCGITHVCSVTQWGQATRFHESKGITYHVIHIEDKPHCKILDHLDKAVEFIEENLANGKRVLVHCNQGRSRSATVMTAYFIKTRGCWKRVEEHVNEIKSHRKEVCPNPGFMKQLEQYRIRCIVREEFTNFLKNVHKKVSNKLASIVGAYVA
eukprot:CAMPEP_0114537794 /NCGR_PEP_ID=MMETSP0109-20121206/29771_1 /TAXON_ID=29199 /ORGANISM="Chlorarachnion reptans, Strain CCCM449" /LENGTH=399 /DNA_ID=CAMNT_0001721713 /DNA_START=1 /DNA_END=1200 /DNA_ORIENTATION=-